jgi:hypothetical protein
MGYATTAAEVSQICQSRTAKLDRDEETLVSGIYPWMTGGMSCQSFSLGSASPPSRDKDSGSGPPDAIVQKHGKPKILRARRVAL